MPQILNSLFAPSYHPLRLAASVGASLFVAQSACADYIVMKNGDRITGEIRQIWGDELTIEPEYGDEWKVDTAEILEIVGDQDFEIELADGTQVTARLNGVDDSGRQLIITNQATLAVPLAGLAELDQPEEYFDWGSNIDANTVVNEGNTDSRTVRVSATTNLKVGDHRHVADLTLADESLNGVATKEQRRLAYNYGWLFRDPLFLSASATHERDPIRGLQNRSTLGAGLGYQLWDDADRSLTFSGGLGFQSEELLDEYDDNAIGFWLFRLRKDFLGGDLTFFHGHSVSTNISGRDNTVTKTSTGVQLDFTDAYYLNFEVDYDHESNPAPGAEKKDLAILAGVGIEF